MERIFFEIRDKNGTWFRMKLSQGYSKFLLFKQAQQAKDFLAGGGWFGGTIRGEWKALDEGFIRFRAGKTKSRFSENGDLTTQDLIILGPEGYKTYDSSDSFGMQLFQFLDFWGPNAKGEGILIQPWVVAMTPGRISWKSIG